MVGVFLLMTHGSSIVLFFVGFVFENPFDFDLRLCINRWGGGGGGGVGGGGGGWVCWGGGLFIEKVTGKGMAM